MKTKIFLLFTVLSFIMLGCLPQSKYTPEEFDIPENFRIVETLTEHEEKEFSGDSIVHTLDSSKLAWQHYFKDETLIDLIQKGLNHNFDIRMAIKNLEIYHLQYKQAGMELLPDIHASIASGDYQWRSKEFYSTPNSKWYSDKDAPENMYFYRGQNITGLNLSWEIDIWGKIRSQKAEHFYNYLSTLEAKKAVQTKLVADIATSYYRLLALYTQLSIAESNYQLSERTLRMVELQYESGNTTALAKQQTKSQMLATKALIPKIKQQISAQENNLHFLTGSTPGSIEVNPSEFENTFTNVEKNYSIPLSMVSYRTDVSKAEQELWAANARVGVSQANRYPRLAIDLSFGVNSLLPANWFNIPGALFGGIIGNLTQPLFNKKRLKTKFEQAKIDREVKEIQLQKTVYQAIHEISNLLTLMSSLDEQIKIAEEQVINSELTITQSNLLFNSGYASYLEVINAQRVALESEIQLSQLKEERMQLKVLMYKALGGGW